MIIEFYFKRMNRFVSDVNTPITTLSLVWEMSWSCWLLNGVVVRGRNLYSISHSLQAILTSRDFKGGRPLEFDYICPQGSRHKASLGMTSFTKRGMKN